MAEIVRDGILGEWIEITARQKKVGRTKPFNQQAETVKKVSPPKLSLADQVYKLHFYPNLASIPSPIECLTAINLGIQEIPKFDPEFNIEIKEIFYNPHTIDKSKIPENLKHKATAVKSPRVIKQEKIIIACKFFKLEEHPKPIHAIIEYDDGMAGAEERLGALMERGYSPEIIISFYQPLFPSLTKPLRE